MKRDTTLKRMSSEKKEEYARGLFTENISNLMGRSGWIAGILNGDNHYDDGVSISGQCFYSGFQVHQNSTVVRAVVSCETRDLDKVLGYGICDVSIKELSSKDSYSAEFLEDMKTLVKYAEDNLVKVGIPFIEGYKFHSKNAANNTRRNISLRKKYLLNELEEIDMY